QPVEMHLLWSLTWSAYFALWVMGAMAFAPAVSESPARPVMPNTAAEAGVTDRAAKLDNLELMAIAIVAEAAHLQSSDPGELAARVLALGGYESIEGSARDNERARLALRLAAQLSSQSS